MAQVVEKGFVGLAGKRAVITGGAGGLAIATAQRLAIEGVEVVLTDINLDGAAAAAEKIVASTGGKVGALKADVTSSASVAKLYEDAAAKMGGIDILVTCAGGYKAYADFEQVEEDDWDRVIALNLKSVYLCSKAVLPYMKPNKWGRIVNLGSIAGRSTSTGKSPVHYSTAKAGVSMLTQCLAKDIAPYGITANTVAPSTTKTDRILNLMTPDKEELFTKMTPVGYIAQPEDIVGMIVFLVSDEARYVTGATIDVNGGRLMAL